MTEFEIGKSYYLTTDTNVRWKHPYTATKRFIMKWCNCEYITLSNDYESMSCPIKTIDGDEYISLNGMITYVHSKDKVL